MANANKSKETIKKIAQISVNVLIWIVVALSLFITILVFSAQGSKDGVPSIFGKSLVTIESGSMKPTYKDGDLVFMTKLTDAEKAELKPGDIITYFAPIDINNDGKVGDINTHRIVRIDQATGTVYTQGDNKETNPVEDNYTLKYMDIIGKCTEKGRVGGIGAVIGFLRSPLGFFLCIVLPLILFFLYELYRFISLLISVRAKKAPVSSETREEIERKAIEEYIASQKKAEEENKNGNPEADGGVKEEKTAEYSESGESKE